jgi:adenylate cyclase
MRVEGVETSGGPAERKAGLPSLAGCRHHKFYVAADQYRFTRRQPSRQISIGCRKGPNSDLRGFTQTSEEKLSFDVVFLLNQFLGRMAEAIEETSGYVDKFMGDGIVSIFGMNEPTAVGVTQAMAAIRAMGGLLEPLNLNPREELPHPLGFDIGIHKSAVILGRMGIARKTEVAGRITALGKTVNIASRLEGMTKELGG